ncbi:amidohydrolase family protein [Mesorhizobium sp. B2-3-5]|uniref:amidohydrolase family protein n=1 Tax=Mesorhizobium sp. B2-3-5 TaxID=2589958 RepID=UPI001FEF27E5|nr:amidohydrolase family protein [Mesorhizobium sp. B2-3-5]
MVGENPETNFILILAGMLTGMEPETTDAWKESLRTLSATPDSHAKLSGLGRFVHRNDAALIACIIDNAIDILGPDHLMFGSNFRSRSSGPVTPN